MGDKAVRVLSFGRGWPALGVAALLWGALIFAVLSLPGCTAQATDPVSGLTYHAVVLSVNGGAAWVEYTDGTRSGVLNPFPEAKAGDRVTINQQGYADDSISGVVR